MSDGAATPEPGEAPAPNIDLDLLEYLCSLSPADRLRRHDQARELVRALRQAGVRLYGFDPRAPEAAG